MNGYNAEQHDKDENDNEDKTNDDAGHDGSNNEDDILPTSQKKLKVDWEHSWLVSLGRLMM